MHVVTISLFAAAAIGLTGNIQKDFSPIGPSSETPSITTPSWPLSPLGAMGQSGGNSSEKADKKGKQSPKKNDGPNDKGKDGKNGKEGKEEGKDGKAADLAGATADCRIGNALTRLADISEASGIAAGRRTPGILWAHSDAYRGGATLLYALDAQGSVKGKVRVEGVKVDDLEDIAVGACGPSSCLYLADIGDNTGVRRGVTVYRVAEPLPSDAATRPAEALRATYPDGPHDAEAIFVAEGQIYIMTKGSEGPISLYRFPSTSPSANSTLVKVGVLQDGKAARGQWITGASASPDGNWVALRTHDSVYFHSAAKIGKGDFASPLRFDLSGGNEPQGEGVALGPGGALYLVGEGGGKSAPSTFLSGSCKLP
jgi:hypothetical protein